MIKIQTNYQRTRGKEIRPKDINPFQTQLYEIRVGGIPDETFLFADGGQIMYFYDCDGELRLGYQTKKNLREFNSHITCVPINGTIDIKINIV